MRGTMLWFNAENDVGALRTDDGDRIEVPGAAFAADERPVGRCGGKTVDFQSHDGVVSRVSFVAEAAPRRARMRRRG